MIHNRVFAHPDTWEPLTPLPGIAVRDFARPPQRFSMNPEQVPNGRPFRPLTSILITKAWTSGSGQRSLALPWEIKKTLKSEARNPKSETNPNDHNSNDPNKGHNWHRDAEVVFVIRAFTIGICFEFRY
jgi:hypothetical protein